MTSGANKSANQPEISDQAITDSSAAVANDISGGGVGGAASTEGHLQCEGQINGDGENDAHQGEKTPNTSSDSNLHQGCELCVRLLDG